MDKKTFVFTGITIPFHSKDLKPETLKSILRQVRIEFGELKKNL